MKICFICPEYPEGPHGGIGTMVQIISRELVQMGHEVRVIGIYPKAYPAPDYEIDQGVNVWRLRVLKGKFGWVLPYIQQFNMIKSWVKNKEIDIIEGPDSRGWFAYWPKLTVPVLIRAHGSNRYFAKILGFRPNMLTNLLEKKSYLRADALVSVSQYTATITKQVFNIQRDFIIIHNGIEIPTLNKDQVRENNRVIFSGSLNNKKGIFRLVEAFILICENNSEAKLEIYGKDTIEGQIGSVKEYLINLIPVVWRKNFIFKGHVSRGELFNVYKTSSIAVFPSFAEAFAIAPIESMACGCPTIYSKLGSGKELIEDGIDGLLIDPKQPTEIAKAIQTLLTNPILARRIGQLGRKKIEVSFSKELMTQQSLEFYQKCVQKYNK
jgi:glycogen synthase